MRNIFASAKALHKFEIPMASMVIALLMYGNCPGQQDSIADRILSLERQIMELKALRGMSGTVESKNSTSGNIHLFYGNPGGRGTILDKKYFVISYLYDLKIPDWVAYHLSRNDLSGSQGRTDNFRADPGLPVNARAEPGDYRRSGYDQGHMAPAADFKRSKTAMSLTFLLSNMTPQTPNLNRHIWRALEDEVRNLADIHGKLWVFTGSLLLHDAKRSKGNKTIGKNKVAVPSHLYKVILCEHDDDWKETFAFIIKNQRNRISGKPADYLVSVDSVESLTSLDFFSALPDSLEEKLESNKATNWPIK